MTAMAAGVATVAAGGKGLPKANPPCPPFAKGGTPRALLSKGMPHPFNRRRSRFPNSWARN
jgi:hypothetical protein